MRTTQSPRRAPLALLIAASLLAQTPLAPHLVWAQVEESQDLSAAERAYKRGVALFKAHDYEGAVVSFMQVYRVSPNPTLVYNIARSFEELKRFDEAALYYQKYLELKPDAPDAPEVELSIETLLHLAQSRAQEAARPQPQPQPASSARGAWGWGAVGLGGALAVGGVVMGLSARSSAAARDAATSAASYTSAQRDMRTSAVVADVLYISAAALAATGVYLLLTGDEEGARPRSGLQVSASPQHVTLAWSF